MPVAVKLKVGRDAALPPEPVADPDPDEVFEAALALAMSPLPALQLEGAE